MRRLIPIAACLTLVVMTASIAHAQTSDGERKVRNVTPDNIPVIILPPRKQEKSKTPTKEAPIPGDVKTVNVLSDGAIKADSTTLRFFGAVTLPSDTLCESANGGRWACGLRAYVAIRNFVHGKEIKCEALRVQSEATISQCFRERINISEWMLNEGWAFYDEAARDEALLRSAEDARKNSRGIWASGSQPIKR